MKKVFYIFPVLLIIGIIVLHIILFIALRVLKALSILLLARLDLVIPLILGSIFSPTAALDVILLNFILLEPFNSLSDICALYIIGFSVVSIIIVAIFYKKFTIKNTIDSNKALNQEFDFSYSVWFIRLIIVRR